MTKKNTQSNLVDGKWFEDECRKTKLCDLNTWPDIQSQHAVICAQFLIIRWFVLNGLKNKEEIRDRQNKKNNIMMEKKSSKS